MVVFNIQAGVQVLLAALPGGLVYAVLHYGMGLETAAWWGTLVAALCLVPLDGLMRAAGLGGETDDEGNPIDEDGGFDILALVRPSSGGHVFFLPCWLIGMVATGGLATGVFAG